MTATLADIQTLFATDFPHSQVSVVAVSGGTAHVKQVIDHSHLRPGNTVSGPTMMALADCALYAAILSDYGLIPLAVTTQLNINFFNKPPAGHDLYAECTLLKAGKRLAIGEVSIHSEGRPELIAHATGTYAIPPKTVA